MHEFLAPLIPERVYIALGSVVGIVWSYLFGHHAEAMAWLFGIMAVDFFLGTWCACKNGEWASGVCKRGVTSKFLILCVCAAGYGLDTVSHATFIQTAFISVYSFSEFGSILETIDRLGYGGIIPENIAQFLREQKQKKIGDKP